MDHVWGRQASAGTWITTRPVGVLAALLMSAVSVVAVAQYRYAQWTPLQQFYLAPYVRSTLLLRVGLTRPGTYAVLTVVDGAATRLAVDADVASLSPPEPGPTEGVALRLAPAATAAGVRALTLAAARYDPSKLQAFLRTWIYRDQRLRDLAWPAVAGGLAVLALGLLVGLPQDAARARTRRHGRRLKGPELVSPGAFTRRLRADGIGWAQARSRGLFGRTGAAWVRVPRAVESSHFLVMGDTGTGKSALIRQLLLQIEERGDTAIVYDPALEYVGQFYDPDRGDQILNPLDARTPFWTPADELRLDAEALTLAESLFPEKPNENQFFRDAPTRIMAHLLTKRPDAAELVEWLADPEGLDPMLAGTPYAVMIDRAAGPQRAGVLASLNMISDALQLLPARSAHRPRWSATAWSETRRGWLFFTSTPETRARLVPLTSLWLDTLVLRLMNPQQPASVRTWFVIDELASLQRLPQLHTAMTEARKSNSPIVLGFQGRSQVAKRYGQDAEAMLSQPSTKIFLRTTEPEAAKWISESIGQVETERLRQGRSTADGWASTSRHSTTYGLERQVEPLVLPSEVSGLPNLHGYLKLGNLVTRLRLPFVELPNRQPALLARADAAHVGTPRPRAAAAGTADAVAQALDPVPHGAADRAAGLGFGSLR
ncbi:MAG: type IV secretion system DNA-binding domain-containing protein [Vicinamibacterales bacterium]